VLGLLDRLPEYDVFATVDELNAEIDRLAGRYPALVAKRRVGTSRAGDPLWEMTIGAGDRHALVFAFPHPNEPVGGLTSIALADLLCEDDAVRDEIGLTWHIVACVDPDGARLNEGWFHGPFTRSHYARHFYRPAGDEQVDWTFPLDYKTAYFDAALPETVALMRIIDEFRPEFVAALHNAETGGVYYYLSDEADALYPLLHEIPTRLGLKLDLGEPESANARRFAPAIFQTLDPAVEYEAQVAQGLEPEITSGGSSASYSGRYGAFYLVPELPYWTDPAADDVTVTETAYSETLRLQSEALKEFHDFLQRLDAEAAPHLRIETPFLRGGRAFISWARRSADEAARRADDPANARPATVAEVHSCGQLVHLYKTRGGGMLLRALEAEVRAGLAGPEVRGAHRELAETFERWCADADRETPEDHLPIRSLVGTQLGAILAAAFWLDERAAASTRA
jgi:Zinc carboxypeptidase